MHQAAAGGRLWPAGHEWVDHEGIAAKERWPAVSYQTVMQGMSREHEFWPLNQFHFCRLYICRKSIICLGANQYCSLTKILDQSIQSNCSSFQLLHCLGLVPLKPQLGTSNDTM